MNVEACRSALYLIELQIYSKKLDCANTQPLFLQKYSKKVIFSFKSFVYCKKLTKFVATKKLYINN